jgi:hypothetical protein
MRWVLLDVSGLGSVLLGRFRSLGMVCRLCCTRCHGSNLSWMCEGWFLLFISVVMLYMVF